MQYYTIFSDINSFPKSTNFLDPETENLREEADRNNYSNIFVLDLECMITLNFVKIFCKKI